ARDEHRRLLPWKGTQFELRRGLGRRGIERLPGRNDSTDLELQTLQLVYLIITFRSRVSLVHGWFSARKQRNTNLLCPEPARRRRSDAGRGGATPDAGRCYTCDGPTISSCNNLQTGVACPSATGRGRCAP